MVATLRQLLILQDRDHKILQVQSELAGFDLQRQTLQAKAVQAQSLLDQARLRFKQLETERKEAELEVEANQQQIGKYSLQQYQTKKNEEYRALAHEIESCQQTIRRLEDRQLELMEQAEAVQKEVTAAAAAAAELKRLVESQMNDLHAREQNLHQQLADLQRDRAQLTTGIEESCHARYERILRHRGEKVVVGIDRGVCAGCHMTLPPQVLISCQTDQEMVSCPNCGRILYYSPEMDLSVPAER